MRAFVAIEINSSDVIDSIKKIQSEFHVNAKPVDIGNIHFTMQFLGDVKEDRLEEVKKSLAVIDFAPFDVNFFKMGAFPKPKFPRVIWVGVDDVSKNNLASLAKKVQESLSPLGFVSDKPFSPHVTIFRIKSKNNDVTEELKKYNGVNFGTQHVTELKLKKSELTSSGPIYSDLQVVRSKI